MQNKKKMNSVHIMSILLLFAMLLTACTRIHVPDMSEDVLVIPGEDPDSSYDTGERNIYNGVARDINIIEHGEITDDADFPETQINFIYNENRGHAEFYITNESGDGIAWDFGELWSGIYGKGMKFLRFPPDKPGLHSSYVVAVNCDMGSGVFERTILIYLRYIERMNGAPVYVVEPIKWPFSKDDYGFSTEHRNVFYGGEKPLFEFLWRSDTEFELSCPLGGDIKRYEVNTAFYNEYIGDDFSEFDRALDHCELTELHYSLPDDDGVITVDAAISYGIYHSDVMAKLVFKYNAETHGMEFQSVEFYLPPAEDGEQSVFEK